MIWEGLNENLVMKDLDAKSFEEVFRILGGRLTEEGFCKDSFVDALIKREKSFSTGINMGGVGIAVPHTDRIHVNKSGMAIGRLKEPILFYQMGTSDVEVQVRLVFMLAVDDPDKHIDFLQRILLVFQDQEVLKHILEAKETADIIGIIKEKETADITGITKEKEGSL